MEPGAELTVGAGSTLNFGTGVGLNIYGTLDVNGTSGSHATFGPSGTSWDGVYFGSGSNGAIEYATLAGAGITVSNADVAIDTSSFSGSGGIAIYVTGSSAEVDVSRTSVSGYGDGINFTSSAFGHVWRNRIDVSSTAFTTSYYADPYLGAYPYHNGGRNKLLGDWQTVAGSYGSTIWGGSSGYNGNNYICDGASFHDAGEYSSSTVTLVGNYWPDEPDIAGGVDWSNNLGDSDDFCPPIADKGLVASASGEADAVDPRLLEARALMSEAAHGESRPDASTFDRAAGLLQDVRADHAGDRDAVAALVALFRLSRLQGNQEHRAYFESLTESPNPDRADALGILVQAYRYWGEADRARQAAEDLSKLYPDDWHAFYAVLSLFEMDLEAEDYASAAAVLNGMEAGNDFESDRLASAWRMLERRSGQTYAYDVSPKVRGATLNPAVAAPGAITLAEAYPNPFNPSTEIRFELRERSDIAVMVYDGVGRVVEHLLDRTLEAGGHSVTWDATNQASGTYFVVIRTEKVSRSIPVVLLR